MNTDKAIAYLKARLNILSRENAQYIARSEDNRCSSHTRIEWLECAQFARAEIYIVRQALEDLQRSEP